MSYLPKDCPILFKYGPKKCRGHAACTTTGLPPPLIYMGGMTLNCSSSLLNAPLEIIFYLLPNSEILRFLKRESMSEDRPPSTGYISWYVY